MLANMDSLGALNAEINDDLQWVENVLKAIYNYDVTVGSFTSDQVQAVIKNTIK